MKTKPFSNMPNIGLDFSHKNKNNQPMRLSKESFIIVLYNKPPILSPKMPLKKIHPISEILLDLQSKFITLRTKIKKIGGGLIT